MQRGGSAWPVVCRSYGAGADGAGAGSYGAGAGSYGAGA